MQKDTSLNPSYIGLRPDLIAHIEGKNLRILDVGCSVGSNGSYLIDKNIATIVYGIEFDNASAEIAKSRLTKVINGDLESLNLTESLGDIKFDYIILGDVLEHIRSPETVLSTLVDFLAPDGKTIISLPNIRHIDVFIHIFCKGYWPLNDRGIFDKTHIRFFTLKNMEDLILNSKLVISYMKRNFRRRDAIGSRFGRFSIERLLKKLFPDLYTFQYIFVCKQKTVNTV